MKLHSKACGQSGLVVPLNSSPKVGIKVTHQDSIYIAPLVSSDWTAHCSLLCILTPLNLYSNIEEREAEQLKRGKAQGPDQIINEMMMYAWW